MLEPAASSVQVTHNLCNHLVKVGCEVHVFTAPRWLLTTSALGKGTPYHLHICFYRRTQLRSYQAQTALASLFWRLIRLAQHVWAMIAISLGASAFDVVHTQILPVPCFDYFCLRFIARRTPVVCTVHELVPHSSKYRRLTGAFFLRIYRDARLLFVYTDYTRNRLVQLGIAPEKILKIPHGNLEHLLTLKQPPASAAASDAPPVVLFIGGIRQDKGLDTLIKATAHLRQKIGNLKLQVAGAPGPHIGGILKLVQDLNLQDVIDFRLGYLTEQEFADYLGQATVVALPYRRIEQSGVAIAACTFGKAIVATRSGGVAELVTEAGNGLLVPMDDSISFAEALKLLLRDENKRRLFELRSAEYAQGTLSWGPIAAKTVEAYRVAIMHREMRAAPTIAEPS